MTLIEQALADVAALLDAARIPYMLVGGLANAIWGEPRATIDIDVTVWVDEAAIPAAIGQLAEAFQPLVSDARAFVADTRVLPLQAASGVRIDVIFGLLPFEREAIERARRIEVAGILVAVCTPEDLILMKIVSERGRDQDDARAVAGRRLPELDLGYLEPRLRELAIGLDMPEILERWTAWTRRRL